MLKYVLLPILTAFLGAYAGKEGTSLAWRRFGIPALLAVYAYITTSSFISTSLLFVAIPLSIGYGIPDDNDKGSVLGRFVCKYFKKPSSVLRGLIALLISICFFMVAKFPHWFIGTLILVVIWYVFGGDDIIKNEGSICGLLVEDLILYGSLGVYAICVIGK